MFDWYLQIAVGRKILQGRACQTFHAEFWSIVCSQVDACLQVWQNSVQELPSQKQLPETPLGYLTVLRVSR